MSVTDGDPPFTQPTRGHGAVEDADATRQAQQSFSNDTPTDVNFNAVVCRSQALTVDIAGKNYEAASSRRQMIADRMLGAIPPPK